MNKEDLEDAIKQQPFVPVQLRLSNGAVYEVAHPDNILIRKRVSAVAVGESIHLIDMMHINQVVPVVPQQ